MEHLWSQVIVPGDVMVPSPPPAPGAGSGPSYQAVIDSVPDALLLVTEDGTISLVNAAAERMFGYTRTSWWARTTAFCWPRVSVKVSGSCSTACAATPASP